MDKSSNLLNYNAAGFPGARGLYDPAYEHDSCGVGFIAKLNGEPDHSLVVNSIKILINLEHRGAVGGDKGTGDGAGLMLQIPDKFFQSRDSGLDFKLPKAGDYAVAMVFLPTESTLLNKCKKEFENIVRQEDCRVLGWRKVPVHNDHLGELAKSTQPQIEHLFVSKEKMNTEAFERKLYVIRRLIEKQVLKWNDVDTSQFYVPSFSCKTIIYKGLLTGTQLSTFYPDLKNNNFTSAFSIVHQRYSTNTLPTWNLAQPFRHLAHNGEINTLRGNINRMRARESHISSALFGEDIEKIKPILIENGSDSSIFDNGLELLLLAGRSLPHSVMMMVPEAYGPRIKMSEDKRAFYEYHSALMEPWDGPAALAFTDGRYIGATLDRNGLRPARYTVTKDGLVVMASETGVLDIPAENILSRGRLQPGKMFLVDLQQQRIVPDNEIKAKISRQRPYRRWVRENHIQLRGLFTPSKVTKEDAAIVKQRQHAFGYTDEELKMILNPMASRGQEPVGSMGNDIPLAILSNKSQLLFAYFKQLFAQVTNPPIDPLREELVMSLESFVGREKNFLEETPEHYRGLKLSHPILTPEDMMRIKESEHPDIQPRYIDILFSGYGGGNSLKKALNSVFQQAYDYIQEGATLLILTDRNMDKDHAPIPVLLAASGLHHFLINKGLRNSAAIIVESGEVREVMHFALLIAFGTDAICPYLAFSTIHELCEANMLEQPCTAEEAMDNYIQAVKKGLLKTISRMGLSTLHSFFGSQIFEAIGLGSELINKYFCNTASRIGGIGLNEIAEEVYIRHRKAFPDIGETEKLLEAGGNYHIRVNGENHLWSTEAIYLLQMATRNNDYDAFKKYTKILDYNSSNRATLRSLFTFKKGTPVPIDEVEPVEKITKRFVGAAMSYGSISKEAHEAVAIGMNRLGARSNSGEGGEDPARYIPLKNGDSKRSRIKQIASGRFGVTTEYVMNADELQIKIAQGAKPGEGGQLPGHKVSEDIARVRHTTPGVTLISPPPHHDIYSIEDIAQLIYDLKSVNPDCRVSVKLVSEVGVGTIASGVAKAKSDTVLVSGHDGGTGASPLTSIKHTGLPWELGLAETQQSLIYNKLRDRIRVQTDGQIKTGRDLAVATLLGAEEYGFGTAMLITLGCIMMRKCHLNTCPVGVATQDKTLRSRFTGKPEYVERFLRFIAQEFREYMAEFGFRTIDEMVGRVDMLDFQPAIDHWKAKKVDLTPLLLSTDNGTITQLRCCQRSHDPDENEVLDLKMIELSKPAIDDMKPVTIKLPVRNVHRTVGSRLSGLITKKYGAKGLPEDTINLKFEGSAGQSVGAFLAPGITMHIEGDANDYLGKSMSGGRLILVPPAKSTFVPHKNVIVGNVVLYGATGGEVYINGKAGERFAVRNSGAKAVVEGVGDHGCEYMTGGIVVVIGSTGNNFAAGMSGGIAYVFDENELFDTKCNLDMVDLESVWQKEDKRQLHDMLEAHYRYTNSPRAQLLLENWETYLPLFVKVMPIDYRKVLERMKLEEDTERATVSATEEVYNG
ncbi:glutamate synthase large subunit [candidate division KSB1 bacterium]|nr:glutamate synthase large subunit [candidate division KSB1 bacterium]